jgi:hypothetical protein
LQEGPGLGTGLYQLRTLRECYLLGEAAEIDFPVRAWIDLGREPLTGLSDIIHE